MESIRTRPRFAYSMLSRRRPPAGFVNPITSHSLHEEVASQFIRPGMDS
jgi:hypothetical protein